MAPDGTLKKMRRVGEIGVMALGALIAFSLLYKCLCKNGVMAVILAPFGTLKK